MQLWPAFHLCWVCKPVRQTTERIQILYIEISGLKYTAALPSNLGGYIRCIYIYTYTYYVIRKVSPYRHVESYAKTCVQMSQTRESIQIQITPQTH